MSVEDHEKLIQDRESSSEGMKKIIVTWLSAGKFHYFGEFLTFP